MTPTRYLAERETYCPSLCVHAHDVKKKKSHTCFVLLCFIVLCYIHGVVQQACP